MEKKDKEIKILSCILCLLLLIFAGYIIFENVDNKYNDNNDNCTTTESTNIQTEKTTIENKQNKNEYTIDKIRRVQDAYEDDDTNVVKAQKIAKEIEYAINKKDYYYLAKIVGNDADYIVKYGIYNYSVDINDYEVKNEKYIFKETYKSSSVIEEPLGNLLVIQFITGGKIEIEPNCSGV